MWCRADASVIEHLLNESGTVSSDDEGLDLVNNEEARTEAVRAARSIMIAELSEGRLCLSCCVEARGEDSRPVLTLPFRDAVTVTGI